MRVIYFQGHQLANSIEDYRSKTLAYFEVAQFWSF